MSDKDLMTLSTLDDIKHSIDLIVFRFQHINSPDDFLANENGLLLLDSISMRFVAIGEGFKNIDKLTDNKLLQEYPLLQWTRVKGIRDILSHHYFDLDAETIFDICDNNLDELLSATESMIIKLR